MLVQEPQYGPWGTLYGCREGSRAIWKAISRWQDNLDPLSELKVGEWALGEYVGESLMLRLESSDGYDISDSREEAAGIGVVWGWACLTVSTRKENGAKGGIDSSTRGKFKPPDNKGYSGSLETLKSVLKVEEHYNHGAYLTPSM